MFGSRRRCLAVGVAAEVKNKLTVVEVVGETVSLKKAGTTYKGLCPFHGEKTPSFVVTPQRESWHCFGCGLGGDIFSFVMQRDGVTFPEALRTLAQRAGVEIDERTQREDAHKARLRAVLDSAIAFYHAVLTASNAGKPALDYLHGRGFSDATIETYQLGWAPSGWDQMTRTLATKRDVRPEELVEVGLASPRQSGRGGVYDKFRARVLFPIRDQNGHAVGLGGRLLEGEGPKYLNSPATPLFDKSRTLYPIDKAKGPIRKLGQAVIVEGYTDALMAHQAGFENVVASLGTALTPGQVALLTRYATRIVLAYDVDAAGEKAGGAGMSALVGLIGELQKDTSGVKLEDVRVARLPDGKDPDEVVRESPAVWEAAIAKAKPLARIPDRLPHGPVRPQDELRPDRLRRSRHAGDPRGRRTRSGATRRSARSAWRPGVEERVLRQVLERPARAIRSSQSGPLRGSPPTRSCRRPTRCRSTTSCGRSRRSSRSCCGCSCSSRTSSSGSSTSSGRTSCRARSPASCSGRSSSSARRTTRASTRRSTRRPCCSPSTTKRQRSPERCMPSTGPDARGLDPAHLDYEVTRLLLELEDDQLRDRSDYNEAAQGEAERAGDREAIARLMLERRQINEARLSLDRRRDQTRLLAGNRR